MGTGSVFEVQLDDEFADTRSRKMKFDDGVSRLSIQEKALEITNTRSIPTQ
jgi:hypothetical protein